jgi:hypothetical protein
MAGKRDRQRGEKKASDPRPPARRPVAASPPKRRPVLLVLSALAVLLWTLFLAWMAWQS